MEETRDPLEILEKMIDSDPRYRIEAYSFVMQVIDEVQLSLSEKRHIDGKELLDGLKMSASEKFGPMAKEVLNSWGLQTTEDIGNVVFNLVRAGLLAKTEQDTIDDFREGYDFQKVFEDDYFGG